MTRRANPISDCPLTAALAALGGKWKLIIVYWLNDSPRHFAGLKQLMPSISAKVLAEQLRELEADGIVARTPTGAVPAPVIYRLTAYGETLLPIVEAVRVWGEGHLRRSSALPRPDGMGCGSGIARLGLGQEESPRIRSTRSR